MNATQIGSCFINSFNNAETINEPYNHWIFDNVVPDDVSQSLRSLPFESPSALEESGTREINNKTRVYFDIENQQKYGVCSDLAKAFQSKEVISTIQNKCEVDLTGSYLRIEYAQDIDGFWLVPHTDIGPKLFTMLFYISDDEQHRELGTDIYADKDTHVARSPFKPNSTMIFIPSDHSWHGFEPRKIEGIRKSIIINYVTDEWRAREQLAFPDKPIAV